MIKLLETKHKISYHNNMNKLPDAIRSQIITLLVEGSSMRSVSRITGVSINTVTKLLMDAGKVCASFHDEAVQNVKAKRIQCDEIWSFVYAKAKNVDAAVAAPEEAGDVWTWTAIDSDSKLIVSFRDSGYALEFMDDVAKRLANRVQLTTDGHKAYLEAVEEAFGNQVDFAQLIKLYGNAPDSFKGRYSPSHCTGAIKQGVVGKPDYNHISTSHVERHNLTMRMSMRRFTRLTNAFSKKLENHIHMLSLYFVHYNFCRIHKSLRVTPAMQAGLIGEVKDMDWIVGMIDAAQSQPAKRGKYKPRISN